jgi:phosphohistidine phosphatase SixA
MLYLVRHAKAGDRHSFHGDDELRPLSKAGERQAAAISHKLAKRDVTVLISSPFLRCVQTLEPLGHVLREPVHVDERLAEGAGFVAVMELFASLPEGAVLCSHGDVIPEVIDALVRRGCELASEPQWQKASTWVLHREDGLFTSVSAWPPPHI